jgi:hypothetical protein
LGQKGNYVLSVTELQEYRSILQQQADTINTELARVNMNLHALTGTGILRSYSYTGTLPRCTTLVDVLTFILERGRAVLSLTNMLVAGSKQRNEANEAAERG